MTHGQQAVTFCEDLTRFLPDFDSKDAKAYYGKLQTAHRHMLAVQALTAELRTQLHLSHRYVGSKLQLMTEFRVKQSELANEPLYVGVWSAKEVPLRRLDRPPSDAELAPAPTKKKEKKRERVEAPERWDDNEYNEDGLV